MTQPDFTDPAHRIDNYATNHFFKAYALLRRHLFSDDPEERCAAYVRLVCGAIEEHFAVVHDVPLSLLEAKLVAAGGWDKVVKSAQDEAEAPELGA